MNFEDLTFSTAKRYGFSVLLENPSVHILQQRYKKNFMGKFVNVIKR